jgi:QueF-like protein
VAAGIQIAETLCRQLPQSRRLSRGLHGKRIAAEIKPKWLRIGGYWYPRGGIPIDVFWQTGKLPKGMWVPDQGVAPYRGRG